MKILNLIILVIITFRILFPSVYLSPVNTSDLNYDYDKEIHVQLSDKDTQTLRKIFNGKALTIGSPSCGFYKNISIEIDGKIFAPACDGCRVVEECTSERYIKITNEERDIINSIFEKYGAHFPCI